MDQKKNAFMGLFAAAAIILGYVESLIPFFAGIPGIKLGLANLAVLFILEKYTWKEAALVSVVRILVLGFLFGNMFSILYSLAGAALSLAVMTHGDQCFRRRFPQYRAACRRRPDRGEFRCSLLCSRSPGLRGDHRTSYRFSYTGSPEAGTPVNLPGIRRSRHNIRISNAETAG